MTSYRVKLLFLIFPLIITPAVLFFLFMLNIAAGMETTQMELMTAKLGDLVRECQDAHTVLKRSGYDNVGYYIRQSQMEVVSSSKRINIPGGEFFIINSEGDFVEPPSSREGLDQETLEYMRMNHKGDITYGQGQERQVAVFRYFPAWDWIIVAAAKEKVFLKPVNDAKRIMVMTTAAALFVSLAILYLIIAGISKPIAKLRRGSEKIRQGDFGFQVEVSSRDELGKLAEAFNTMSLHVREAMENIKAEVADRKTAEKALKESENRFRRLVEDSPSAMLVVNFEGKIELVNRKFTETTGYGIDDLSTMETWWRLACPDEADRTLALEKWERSLEKAWADGRSMTPEEYRIVSRDGTSKIVEMLGAVIGDIHLIILVDLTDHKKAEEEKAKLQGQLSHAQTMEAIGVLASGIAHDFNNILQAISGYLQVLQARAAVAPESQNYIAEMEATVARASDLVQRLLTFSRKVDPELKPVDLNQEITHTVRILERTIPRMIEIQTEPAENLHPIQADPGQIERLLMNLGANARDAMPEGGRLVFKTENIRLDPVDCQGRLGLKPGDHVLLSVQDSGQGMNRETLERMFEPFFTTKGVGKGTGLGLATAYGIVKNHNGHISCYSEQDKGTVFKIYFPAMPSLTEKPAVGMKKPEDQLGGRETILLVDDEESILETTREVLEIQGYRTMTAQSGEQALERYRDIGREIDLIVMDLGMPGMGGMACLKALLEIDPQVKVIVASGYSADNQVSQVINAGGKGFISKPYRMKDLLRLVRIHLDQE